MSQSEGVATPERSLEILKKKRKEKKKELLWPRGKAVRKKKNTFTIASA